MSKYTTELRYICETSIGLTESVGYEQVPSVIEQSRSKIFDFEYPIFDEDYKSVIETKILKHYYMYEIGLETVGLWKLALNEKMNEIMPYYNELYKTIMGVNFNPFNDVDITTTSNRQEGGKQEDSGKDTESETSGRKNTGDTTQSTDLTTTTNNTSKQLTDFNGEHWNYYSDTPQGGVDGLAARTYLTNATNDVNNDNTEVDGTETGTQKQTGTVTTTQDLQEDSNREKSVDRSTEKKYNNTVEYIEHTVGKRGGKSYVEMMKEYIESFINIDVQIISNLSELFMRLW